MHVFEKRHSRVFLTAMTKVSFQNYGTRVFPVCEEGLQRTPCTVPTFILRHVFLIGLFLQLSNVNSWKSLVRISYDYTEFPLVILVFSYLFIFSSRNRILGKDRLQLRPAQPLLQIYLYEILTPYPHGRLSARKTSHAREGGGSLLYIHAGKQQFSFKILLLPKVPPPNQTKRFEVFIPYFLLLQL